MKKLNKIISAIFILAILSLHTSVLSAITFSDISGHWSEKYVQSIAENGLIKGYVDGTYKPNNFINRSEFISIAVRLAYQNGFDNNITIIDHFESNYWAAGYINEAIHLGLIEENQYGDINADIFDKKITREEMAGISANLVKFISPDAPAISDIPVLKDLAEVSKTYQSSVEEVIRYGIMRGDDKARFNPHANATRGEVAAVMTKLVEISHLPAGVLADEQISLGNKITQYSHVADEIIRISGGIEYHIFNKDYKNLRIFIVQGDRIVGIYNNPHIPIVKVGQNISQIKLSDRFTEPEYTQYNFKHTKNYIYDKNELIIWYDGNDNNRIIGFLQVGSSQIFKKSSDYNTSDALGFEKVLCHLQNGFRAMHGKSSQTLDVQVSTVARNYSAKMAKEKFFDHIDNDGLAPWDRLDNAGVQWSSLGENIAMGYTSPFNMLSGYVNSPGHRKNILEDYHRVGIGIVYGETAYNTVVFFNR